MASASRTAGHRRCPGLRLCARGFSEDRSERNADDALRAHWDQGRPLEGNHRSTPTIRAGCGTTTDRRSAPSTPLQRAHWSSQDENTGDGPRTAIGDGSGSRHHVASIAGECGRVPGCDTGRRPDLASGCGSREAQILFTIRAGSSMPSNICSRSPLTWAGEMNKGIPLPVSINISLGTNGDAHDGNSPLCRWINALATAGRCITVASGNAGAKRCRWRQATSAMSWAASTPPG